MPLKHGTVNLLNACGVRQVSFPAHHFVYTTLPKYSVQHLKKAESWIYQNLNGRFYIGQSIVNDGGVISFVTKIGFENEKELSFFKLAFGES